MFYGGEGEEFPSTIDWQNLYYSSTVGDAVNSQFQPTATYAGPYDKKIIRVLPVKLTSHSVAEKFMATAYNIPWVKNPVAYM